MSATNRYPGVKPFEATDSPLFFGRDRDTADLFDLVNREKLAVLFGKSGYGKSSLIKAALIPELLGRPARRTDPATGDEVKVANRPIYVRLNLFTAGKSVMPCAMTAQRFIEAFGADGEMGEVAGFFTEKNLGDRLWHIFKKSRTAGGQPIFLIFDQFEEFFSYPAEAQLQFRQELSELLYTQIPQSVRDSMDGLDRAAKRQIHQPMEVHALFALRSDRLHLLNGMREELPAILHVRHELKALTEAQASEAIVRPARLEGNRFLVKKPFGYEDAALAKIISELKKARETATPDLHTEQQIEAFQLQMVCQTIEQGIAARTKKAGGQQPVLIREADLPDFEQIYQQYYSDKLADLPTTGERGAAHVLLEEEMVIGEELAEMRRVSLPKEVLVKTMHDAHQLAIGQSLFDYLEDRFLIRRETFGQNVHYEVSHDVLLGPLMKSRNSARLAKAERAAAIDADVRRQIAESEAIEAQKTAEAEAAKNAELGKRKRLAAFLSIAGVVMLWLSILGFWALTQKRKAEHNYNRMIEADKKRQAAELGKAKAEFKNTLTDVEIILKSLDGCPDLAQKLQLDTMPRKYPDDGVLQDRVKRIRQKITDQNCE